MQEIQLVTLPLNANDIIPLQQLLSEGDVFVESALKVKSYDLYEYVRHTATGNPIRALLDLNLTTRAVRLVRDAPSDHKPLDVQTRVAAACMAFLISAGVTIEPSISMYEFAQENLEFAADDLLWFRRADNLDPQAYADFALQRTNQVDESAREAAVRQVLNAPDVRQGLSKSPLRWRLHYYCLLKIATLERDTHLTASKKYRALLDWSVNEGFFDATAIAFATMYFGRHRRAGMLKGINTNRCLAGVKNAAWDLTHLSNWSRRARNSQAHGWLFCTADRALAELGRCLVRDESDEDHLDRFFRRHLPTDHRELFKHYQNCLSEAECIPNRGIAINHQVKDIDHLIERAEQILAEEITH